MSCAPAACADCDPVVLERRRQGEVPTGTWPRCAGCAKREEELLANVQLLPAEELGPLSFAPLWPQPVQHDEAGGL